ncbi:UL49.5 protein [Gallid alphaherpesvirus 3]|uniref:Membrane protein n=2 Tax=Gallid alphaherpesvirus 3 TaxID=35250 RepID=O89248_9ALPH|nr:envelope glycoprotein N [Gallid alphaherpesvirus 3]YP_010795650.1 UL49.5 protein [Gallid alphaherpesvirus 3]BAA32586.1 membrane protein [Marek's disease virus serotype 2 MDV2]AEI00259.1 UL49.5 protein [Gallid alphaherpesvirus 3]QEY02312.1 UL49.5 protein [Gallid alphaherpesvirus 3]BAA82946.1 UL49.5 product homolog [Marek's disease virus serotype 2 MDV2]BAB16560.1 UL49.5 protein [Gallid alphaherpesvirus 3]
MGLSDIHHVVCKVLICVIASLVESRATSIDSGRPIAVAGNFWESTCSAVGVSIAFSSGFSVLFYLGLVAVISALLAGSYHACFRLFTASMFDDGW